MEPAEGQYDFDWLERAINAAAKHHIISVVGTPTAAPPAWLTQKHPETLRIDEDGRAAHGNREHNPPIPTIANTGAGSPNRWPNASATIPT